MKLAAKLYLQDSKLDWILRVRYKPHHSWIKIIVSYRKDPIQFPGPISKTVCKTPLFMFTHKRVALCEELGSRLGRKFRPLELFIAAVSGASFSTALYQGKTFRREDGTFPCHKSPDSDGAIQEWGEFKLLEIMRCKRFRAPWPSLREIPCRGLENRRWINYG